MKRQRPEKKTTRKPRKNELRASETEFVVVYVSNGPLGAEVVKGKLASAGIPALLKYESTMSSIPIMVDGRKSSRDIFGFNCIEVPST